MSILDRLTEGIKEKIADIEHPVWTSVQDMFKPEGKLEDAVGGVVKVCEAVATSDTAGEKISGRMKRDAVIKVLDDWIKLPVYLEWLDDYILPFLVDSICKRYNAKVAGGGAWGTIDGMISEGLAALGGNS